MEANLGRLTREPSNAGALNGLRAAFADARAEAGRGPVGELARSAENLLGAQLDGWVSPTTEAAELICQAARGLFALDAVQRTNLAERMDAVASGMSDLLLANLPPARPQIPEPPMLTEREDGTMISPGMFADATPDVAAFDSSPLAQIASRGHSEPPSGASQTSTPDVASTTLAPQPVAMPQAQQATGQDTSIGAIVNAIQFAEEHLGRHIGALVTIASGTDEVSAAVQRTAGELAQTAAEIKRQHQALAQWVERTGS